MTASPLTAAAAEAAEAAEAEALVSIDGDHATIALVAKFRAVRAQRDAAIKELDELKSDLFKVIDAEHAQALTWAGEVVARASDVTTVNFDKKKFAKDHPEMVEDYLKVTESRRLTVS
jgi:predicted phage-related endonuclease